MNTEVGTVVDPFESPAYLQRCENLFLALRGNVAWETVRRVVDLGCGVGTVGRRVRELGPEVMFLDGRPDNVEALRRRGYDAQVHDAHTKLVVKADLVLCLGLLYHSEDPYRVLQNCSVMGDIICVETLCMDQDAIYLLSFTEGVRRRDQSLDGGCSRFSPAWLERAMQRAGYEEVLDLSSEVPAVEPDGMHQGFLYNWGFRNTGNSYRGGYGLRKLYIGRR